MDVTIVDYGVGNLRSVQKAIEHGGHTARVTSSARAIRSARRVLLPGVGSFGAAVTRLRETGLREAVIGAARDGKPLLGICLGMQLLLDVGHEMGEWPGLGLVAGDVAPFPPSGPKAPQIGWNSVERRASPLFKGIGEGMMFYFVHSFCCRPADAAAVGGVTDYGSEFCSVIAAGNIHGAQFHPEKSSRAGLAFLRNFAEVPA